MNEIVAFSVALWGAFFWLLYETDFLRVRLPQYYKPVSVELRTLQSIVNLTPLLVWIGFISATAIMGIYGTRKRKGCWARLKLWWNRLLFSLFKVMEEEKKE